MSRCISLQGEYSDHIPDDEHTCTRCFVFDEDAFKEELRSARHYFKNQRAALERVQSLHRENNTEDGTCQGFTGFDYGYLDSWCVECSDQSGREYGTPWPCATVRAIAPKAHRRGQA